MSRTESPHHLVDWGVAGLARDGENESGDLHVVQPFDHGVLVCVVDGLGHGHEAATASRVAASTLAESAHEPVIALVKRCHEALRATRGVVMSLASFDERDNTLTWLSVGNVEGVLMRAGTVTAPGLLGAAAIPAYESVVTRGGVVGYQLPPLQASVLPVARDDTLIFATDGIHSDFYTGFVASDSPQQLATRIMTRYRKGTDDALVLVARYG